MICLIQIRFDELTWKATDGFKMKLKETCMDSICPCKSVYRGSSNQHMHAWIDDDYPQSEKNEITVKLKPKGSGFKLTHSNKHYREGYRDYWSTLLHHNHIQQIYIYIDMSSYQLVLIFQHSRSNSRSSNFFTYHISKPQNA